MTDHDVDPDDDDLDEDVDDDGPITPDVLANPLAALGLGDGGLPDLGSMFEGLSKVQGVQEQEFEGTAGGGLVRIVANGRMDVSSVEIDAGALDPPDADLLADLVLAALRDLTTRIAAAQQEAMGPLGTILGGSGA